MTERDAAIRVLCRCAETAPDASDLHESVAAVRDWDALIDLAVHHGVIGLAARTLANLDGALPSGAARRFEEQRRSLQRRGLAAAAETVRLLRVLGDAGVEALPLKGPSLAAQAYGDTGARDYGDIDLLVHRRDLERARVALTRDRYAPPPEWNPRDERWYQRTLDQAVGMTRPGNALRVELHGRVHPPFFGVRLERDLWRRQVRLELAGAPIRAMSSEDALLVACTHASRTGWQRLEYVACVAHLARRELDWPVLVDAARRAGALRMLALGLCLAHDVLGQDLPATASRLAGDAPVVRLARGVAVDLLQGDPLRTGREGYSDPRRTLLHVRLRERPRDRVRYVARLMLVPTFTELNMVRLPRPLEPLYSLLRLARIVRLALTAPRRLRGAA